MKKILTHFSLIKSFARFCLLFIAVVTISGCVSFFSKDKSFHTPSPLPVLHNTEVTLSTRWKQKIGNGNGNLWLNLQPAISQKIIYAASYSGAVIALEKKTGEKIWTAKLKNNITGGIGIDKSLLVLGTASGDIVALDATTGKEKWTAKSDGELISVPAVASNIVIAQTVNGKITAFNAATGKQLWQQSVTLPPILLRGSSSPVIYHDSVITGLANGNVMAWNLHSGTLLWQNIITLPDEGSSEMNHMVDIAGTPLIDGKTLYAISYQGNMKAIDVTNGQTLWSHKASSYHNMASGAEHIYFSDASSHLFAVDKSTGSTVWSENKLSYRQLSAPVVYGEYILAGDYVGYIHVISARDGNLKGRYRLANSGIRTLPLVDGDNIYIYTNNGDLTALTLKKKITLHTDQNVTYVNATTKKHGKKK